MFGFPRLLLLMLAAAVWVPGTASRSTAVDNFWLPAGPTPANWNVDGNWSEGGVPDIDFQDVALINNGGFAFVQGLSPHVGGIVLGRATGESGTLEIRSGGSLTAVTSANPDNNGAIIVGQAGTGTLNVLDGGQLTGVSVQSTGTASSINLSGSGQLTSTGSMNLNAISDIAGQNASLSAGTAIAFGGNSTLRLDISGPSAPLIKAGGGISLNGVLELDVSGGTPSPGSTWNLFDAGAVVGQFSQINLASGSLPAGQRFRVRAMADGSSMNGVYGQLLLEQLLVLEIDRDTGAMAIVNSSSTPIAIDAYAITSSHGSFNTADGMWTSLEDQSFLGWIEANPQPTQLAELGTSGEAPVSSASPLTLGTPWSPQFTQLGEDREDVTFRYTTADGEVIAAPVIYSGFNVNDMALIVDPATARGQLRNASPFSVDIEGYSIRSASMSLNPAGWDSLQDNPDVPDWLEANPDDDALSEFKTEGVEMLFSHRAFELGELFDVGGMQDLTFEYLVAGQSQPTLGKVLYQAIPASPVGVLGDYNGDNVVDAADYVVWRKNLGSAITLPNEDPSVTPGQVTQQDYNVWRSNFGKTAAFGQTTESLVASAAAVPEPATCGLIAVLVLLAVCQRCSIARHS